MRYFDDFAEGQVFHTPAATLTEAQIIDFALGYDPQSFHIDRHGAFDGPFGGLIASGFQTLALSWRLFVDTGLLRGGGIGGPGLDDLQWLRPVRPGDSLRCRVEVAEVKPSRSKPDRGAVRWRFQTFNQNDELVMTCSVTSLMMRRPTLSC